MVQNFEVISGKCNVCSWNLLVAVMYIKQNVYRNRLPRIIIINLLFKLALP